MPYLEDVDELAEWLANAAGVYGSYDDEGMFGHPDACGCRLCWTINIKKRMRAAVEREIQKRMRAALEVVRPFHT